MTPLVPISDLKNKVKVLYSAYGPNKTGPVIIPDLRKSSKFQVFECQALSFATRLVRRETLRDAAFLWVTPLVTPRMISGSAAFRAAWAAL